MTSLAKRATPRQAVVMRIVAGAVVNAGHAHPSWNISPVMARSIAKRASGTLTANWPDVLAAPRALSERDAPHSQEAGSTSRGQLRTAGEGGRFTRPSRPPLRIMHNTIGAMAAKARREGQTERHAALVDVLRLIAAHR